ncbi:MAG: membrane dipeptidase [Pseudomonadota bacterium]
MGIVTNSAIKLGKTGHSLFRDALVWDSHQCMPLRPDDVSFLPELTRCKAAGCDVVSLNIGFDLYPWEQGVKMLATFRQWLKANSASYVLIDTIDDIDRAQRENKLAVTFDIEGGLALDEHLPMVELYYDMGVRWMLFAYNKNNSLGGGCNDEPMGLSDFGRRVVREMERVGMVICCSHVSHETAMDIMEMADRPLIFSHSNPAGVTSHYRNVKDEAIKACAQTGGLIAVNGIGDFLGDQHSRTETIVRHIDYCAQLVGDEHVAIGTDYCFDQQELVDYLAQHPDVFDANMGANGVGLVTPEQIPEIAEHLLKMNYSEQAVRNILGENHRRVARAVWR